MQLSIALKSDKPLAWHVAYIIYNIDVSITMVNLNSSLKVFELKYGSLHFIYKKIIEQKLA